MKDFRILHFSYTVRLQICRSFIGICLEVWILKNFQCSLASQKPTANSYSIPDPIYSLKARSVSTLCMQRHFSLIKVESSVFTPNVFFLTVSPKVPTATELLSVLALSALVAENST